MTNDYRAMCAELVDAYVRGNNLAEFIFRARTLLDQPETQPPADGEVAELVGRLQAIRNDYGVQHSADCQRAAALLERLASDNAGLTAAADALWADNISLLSN